MLSCCDLLFCFSWQEADSGPSTELAFVKNSPEIEQSDTPANEEGENVQPKPMELLSNRKEHSTFVQTLDTGTHSQHPSTTSKFAPINRLNGCEGEVSFTHTVV
jgi:hypothetical protein